MGSPDSQRRLHDMFDAHKGAVGDYCRRRLPSHAVPDAVSDVFLVAWRRLDQIPVDAELPWLYGVARHVVMNHQRRGRRWLRLRAKVLATETHAAPDVETQVIRRAEDRQVLESLAKLRPADQELLRLRAWEELSSIEIATALGISPEAVDMRLTRAKRRLATVLSASGYSCSSVPMPRANRNGDMS